MCDKLTHSSKGSQAAGPSSLRPLGSCSFRSHVYIYMSAAFAHLCLCPDCGKLGICFVLLFFYPLFSLSLSYRAGIRSASAIHSSKQSCWEIRVQFMSGIIPGIVSREVPGMPIFWMFREYRYPCSTPSRNSTGTDQEGPPCSIFVRVIPGASRNTPPSQEGSEI